MWPSPSCSVALPLSPLPDQQPPPDLLAHTFPGPRPTKNRQRRQHPEHDTRQPLRNMTQHQKQQEAGEREQVA